MVPSSLGQVVILLLLVLPGIVYAATRRWLRGPDAEDREFSVRVLRAIAVSVSLDATYLLVLGDEVTRLGRARGSASITVQGFLSHPRPTALAVLLLIVAVPWALGCATRLDFSRVPGSNAVQRVLAGSSNLRGNDTIL